jgi:FKBP-type peptidyl-prolyl cis-trans isomerase SlyD
MEIGQDRCVALKYRMKTHLPDGTVKEGPEESLSFIFGVESQTPTLEKALEGAKMGDRLHLHIPAEEIYGEHDPSLIREIPKKGLIKQRLKEGRYYRQMKMGTLVSFKVLEIKPNAVLVDFNKPMAGISVSLDLEVEGVREASKQEINAAIDAQVKRTIGCG